jgi:hypothetical protein
MSQPGKAIFDSAANSLPACEEGLVNFDHGARPH